MLRKGGSRSYTGIDGLQNHCYQHKFYWHKPYLKGGTACHFSKWVKSKNKSGNGFQGQRGLYRV